jgi:hypothetical protein
MHLSRAALSLFALFLNKLGNELADYYVELAEVFFAKREKQSRGSIIEN